MTGFRLGRDGAQGRFGLRPDLSCFGKIIGGGLPVGAFGGRAEIMDQLAPLGPVYQAGTLSGNPLAMAAGLAALDTLRSINKGLNETQSRISSGYRVESASDNAAYWSIATTMRSDNKALSTVQDALGLGLSLIHI